jgi:hypothetical protein
MELRGTLPRAEQRSARYCGKKTFLLLQHPGGSNISHRNAPLYAQPVYQAWKSKSRNYKEGWPNKMQGWPKKKTLWRPSQLGLPSGRRKAVKITPLRIHQMARARAMITRLFPPKT